MVQAHDKSLDLANIEDQNDDWETVVMKIGPLRIQFENEDKRIAAVTTKEDVSNNNNNNNLTLVQVNEIVLIIEYLMKRYMTLNYNTYFKTLSILDLEYVSVEKSVTTIVVRGVKLSFSELVPSRIAVVTMLQKAMSGSNIDELEDVNERYTFSALALRDIHHIELLWGEQNYTTIQHNDELPVDMYTDQIIEVDRDHLSSHLHGMNNNSRFIFICYISILCTLILFLFGFTLSRRRRRKEHRRQHQVEQDQLKELKHYKSKTSCNIQSDNEYDGKYNCHSMITMQNFKKESSGFPISFTLLDEEFFQEGRDNAIV